ncbi:MAG: 1-acyl-sn-glycerol-3-phosphate acyltransferase [Selenomonadaceae bacterium]|nr:1-acyl-sn-glycerol-3-phosphate acyltransferase [Selenomonadaceae bacterium]
MFYWFMQRFLRILFRLFFKTEIRGMENVPSDGKIILAANHMSNWDPPFLACFLERPVYYMAKQELFENPIFGGAIRALHAFPVKRGESDRGAIKIALGVLKSGECLGIFPEGTRSKTGEVQKAEAGVSLIAAISQAPIVPAAIVGTDQMKISRKLFLIFGKPMQFEGKKNDKVAMEKFSDDLMNEIRRLKNSVNV